MSVILFCQITRKNCELYFFQKVNIKLKAVIVIITEYNLQTSFVKCVVCRHPLHET